MRERKAMIAMSGGVDSSVAAYLMQEMGYQCMGTTMKLYANEDIGISQEKTCCSLTDVEDARRVCQSLEMDYYVLNFTQDFEKQVIERFINTYREGKTPNPCIECNRYMKFDKLLQRMKELEYDVIVTGHYARIEFDSASGRYLLKKGLDESKDQSYVLYNLTQEQLAHTMFPLGNYRKTQIRQIAEEQGLINAHKRDSQDICFVPDGDYARFIEKHTDGQEKPGDFVLEDGTVVGQHKGMSHYTIGQRKGLGLSLSAPLYVCDKCMDSNQVVLGPNERLFQTTLEAEDMNWISMPVLKDSIQCRAKIRYQQKEAEAVVSPISDTGIRVEFTQPQRGITPGQALVLYDGDIVIGGGRIR